MQSTTASLTHKQLFRVALIRQMTEWRHSIHHEQVGYIADKQSLDRHISPELLQDLSRTIIRFSFCYVGMMYEKGLSAVMQYSTDCQILNPVPLNPKIKSRNLCRTCFEIPKWLKDIAKNTSQLIWIKRKHRYFGKDYKCFVRC